MQDKVTKYLVAPSQAFAPSLRTKIRNSLLMPQKDSMMHDCGIKFDAESKEEYYRHCNRRAFRFILAQSRPRKSRFRMERRAFERIVGETASPRQLASILSRF